MFFIFISNKKQRFFYRRWNKQILAALRNEFVLHVYKEAKRLLSQGGDDPPVACLRELVDQAESMGMVILAMVHHSPQKAAVDTDLREKLDQIEKWMDMAETLCMIQCERRCLKNQLKKADQNGVRVKPMEAKAKELTKKAVAAFEKLQAALNGA